jgi:hypothetical protein
MADDVLAHRGVVESAAHHYLSHLKAVEAETRSVTIRQTLTDLIDATEVAERLGPQLGVADIKFGFASLKELAPDERQLFLNEFQMALGWDGAPVVAMGTEAAGDPEDPEGSAWECLQTVMILSAGEPESGGQG